MNRENMEAEIKVEMDLEQKKQALADYLRIDPKEISLCTTRINNITTFQAKKMLWLIGTDDEINCGIRGYYEHNLSDLDSAFIGKAAGLSSSDTEMVDRLCTIMGEDVETDILNEALLSVVSKCGDINALIDAAVADTEKSELLSIDGKEIPFGDYFIYKFREGQCSDYEH
ncbi:MAG: hypothetical protein ACE14P_09700 [Methanotrichaceae archaeon]